MKYRVHKVEVYDGGSQELLEAFLNKLEGEVISVLPHIRPAYMILGGTAKVDYYLVVEKRPN